MYRRFDLRLQLGTARKSCGHVAYLALQCSQRRCEFLCTRAQGFGLGIGGVHLRVGHFALIALVGKALYICVDKQLIVRVLAQSHFQFGHAIDRAMRVLSSLDRFEFTLFKALDKLLTLYVALTLHLLQPCVLFSGAALGIVQTMARGLERGVHLIQSVTYMVEPLLAFVQLGGYVGADRHVKAFQLSRPAAGRALIFL